MKGKFLLKRMFAAIVMFGGMFALTTSMAQVTQKHSFTFDGVEVIDGITYVVDAIGGVKGELKENATVEDGVLKLTGGYVEMDENSFDIAQYNGGVSIELFYKQQPGMGKTYRTIFSIGSQNPTETWMGVNYFQFQPTREDDISRLAICNDNFDKPWTSETSVVGDMYTDTRTHYMVAILTDTEITLYLDGQLAGSEPMSGDNHISKVDPKLARLGWTPYTNDPKWLGTIEEFNVYEGAMGGDEIAQRFLDYMGENYFNPYLKTLSATPGELTPEFDPEVVNYELMVPYSARYVTVEAETMIDFASVELFDVSGNKLNLGQPIAVGSDDYYIDVITTAADGATSGTYFIEVIHEEGATSANLESVQLSAGEISTFHTDSLTAVAIVPNGTTSVNLTGVPMWAGAAVTNPAAVDVSSGRGQGQITVTSEDGNATMTYTVDIHVSKFAVDKDLFIQNEYFGFVIGEREDDSLINLEIPMLNDNSTYYRFEESGVAGQYYVRNKNGKYMSLTADPIWNIEMTDAPRADADSSRFIIEEVGPNQFHFNAVGRLSDPSSKYTMGPNGSSIVGHGIYSDKPLDYAYNIWNLYNIDELVDPYDTYLENLEVTDVTIYPNFNKTTKEYFMVVDKDATEVDIAALAVDGTAKITGAGKVAIEGDEGEFIIKVEAATESKYFTEYKLRFKREMPFELRHSYTFADGTARDVVGDAHGTIHGGYILEGQYITEANGEYISLDAEKIAINEYTSLTLELFFTAGDETNVVNTMIAYLGDTQNTFGVNYLFLSHKSRVAVSCLDLGAPWSAEDGINAMEFDDGMTHHFVTTMNNGSVTFYVDGMLIGEQELRAGNKIFNLSNELAYLAKGGYSGDQTWRGGILEFNIYSGEMDAAMVASRSINFPVEDGTEDLALAEILLDDESLEGFNAYKYEYELQLELEEGEEIPVVTATAANPDATVEINQATEFPGVATIKVSTAKGEITYTIAFVGEEEPGTKVEKVEKDKIVVYPTVSSGSFTLAAGANAGSYVIYDLAGNVAGSASFQGGDVEISVANSGVYLLQVNINNNVYTMKVVKK